MLKTEAVRKFLSTTISPIAQLYTPEMELQCNVARDNGVQIKGKVAKTGRTWRGWKDPETQETWKSFRIPWNADTNPEYKDTDLRFNLSKHVEGLGMTGWNFVKRQSIWVGYDFDSLVGHKEGLSNEELDELQRKAAQIPWVNMLRSTGGKGIHLYLFFDSPFPTQNHTEHAALARSLLSILTVEIGFNFTTSVDTCGSILWCYHRKMEGTQGLTWIKEGSKFPTKKIPSNWKEHISVCNRTKKKTRSGDKSIESLSSSLRNFNLDNEHQNILKWFSNAAEHDWWWDTDYNMLTCHTYDLKKCHKSLNLRGIFDTNSTGSSTQNCFAFPMKSGSFIVRRHGSKTREAKTWTTDESGWTKCLFNAEPTIHDACVTNGALENEKGDYVFESCIKCAEAMELLSLDFVYPDEFKNRQVKVKVKKGKLILKIDYKDGDPSQSEIGFLRDKKLWIKVLLHKEEYDTVSSQDTLVRHVISCDADAGWYVNIHKHWVYQSKSNVISVLVSQMIGYSKNEIEQMVGHSILDPWKLVNKPFEDEYLGNREWNKDAAQLSVRPLQGRVEYWWELLEHLGKGIDDEVKANEWCVHNNILNGADYLFAWIASMIQKPTEPLPYLFFFGEQTTGKSTLHEAISLLFKNKVGYTRADQALKNTNGFNAELDKAVLCVVEETDLSDNKLALNRMKDWVTGKTISINAKHKNVYEITNTTHWIQCANNAKYCLILSGDTRIIAIEVGELTKEIPKAQLLQYIEAEVPAFLYELIHFDLPVPEGRLGLPCIQTEVKAEIMADNYNELEQFIEEKTKVRLGHKVSLSEFFNFFQLWLMSNAPTKQNKWNSTRKVGMKFPKKPPVVKGQMGGDNEIWIGNLTFDLLENEDKEFKYILDNKRLKELKL